MSKAWQFFDGWKTLLGGVAYLAVLVWDNLANGNAGDFAGAILAVLGFDPAALGVDWAKVGAAGALVVGVIHKLWKANAERKAGAKPSELLSPPGAVRLVSRQSRQPRRR